MSIKRVSENKNGFISYENYKSIFSTKMTKNQAKFSTGQEQSPENDHAGSSDFIPPYPVWFCLGWFCPLPTAFWIGRIMKEKKTFLKYGILGKLIKDGSPAYFSSRLFDYCIFSSIRKQLSHLVSQYFRC